MNNFVWLFFIHEWFCQICLIHQAVATKVQNQMLSKVIACQMKCDPCPSLKLYKNQSLLSFKWQICLSLLAPTENCWQTAKCSLSILYWLQEKICWKRTLHSYLFKLFLCLYFLCSFYFDVSNCLFVEVGFTLEDIWTYIYK